LFGKRIAVDIANRRYTSHEIKFDARLSISSEPDEATIKLYNLSDDDRASIEASRRGDLIALRAGYADSNPTPVIFYGEFRKVESARENADIITEIDAKSALRAREYGRQLNRTYRAGTQIQTVIRDLLSTCDLGEGNLSQSLRTIQLDGVGGQLNAPFSVHGPAWHSLVSLLESKGFHVTTQGTDIVALGVENALDRTAIVLSETSGLRGQPSVDSRGHVKCDCAMVPDLVPGRLVKIESERVNVTFRANQVQYTGSLYGSEFGATVEGRTLR
jgi:hypothetical protein